MKLSFDSFSVENSNILDSEEVSMTQKIWGIFTAITQKLLMPFFLLNIQNYYSQGSRNVRHHVMHYLKYEIKVVILSIH